MRWTKLCLVLGPRKTVRPKSSLRTNVQLPCVWVGARSRAGLPKVLSRLCERADISSLYQVSRLSNESRRDFRALNRMDRKIRAGVISVEENCP
jgi:hypothetical protein